MERASSVSRKSPEACPRQQDLSRTPLVPVTLQPACLLLKHHEDTGVDGDQTQRLQ